MTRKKTKHQAPYSPHDPQILEQRAGRIDRIKQTAKSINIINVMTNTPIEKKMFEVCKVRKELFNDVVEDNYNNKRIESFTPLTLTQIKDIYVIGKKGSMRWGGNGVVIVRTNHGFVGDIEEKRKQNTEQYRNQNYYSDDAVAVQSEAMFSSNTVIKQNTKAVSKEITGKVTYLNAPLANVNIIILDKKTGTKTDAQGNYTIQAKTEDILQYSYIGFNTVFIVVEDVTTVLNIEMTKKVTLLEETVVTARKKPSKVSDLEKKLNVNLKTPFGTFNPKKSGFDIKYLSGKNINLSSLSIADALSGKFAGVRAINGKLFIRERPVKYVIDGVESSFASQLNLSAIEDIYIVKNKALVIIRTKNSFGIQEEKRKEITEQYKNQNYYNDDAIVTNSETTFSSNTITSQNTKAILKNISGKVTYINAPLTNVNIIIVGKTTGTKTDSKGNYSIKAQVGDIIQYSYVGFATVSIIVEDVTEILDIEMVIKVNELDEVTVTADDKTGKVLELSKKGLEEFTTAMGTFNPKSSGFASVYLDGESILPIYLSLTEALRGKFAGYEIKDGKAYLRGGNMSISQNYPALWDVDGAIFTEEPPIDLSQIKDIHVLKAIGSANRYGSLGKGGVIIVRTKYGFFDAVEAKRKKIVEQYTNKNYYSNDAMLVNIENLNSSSYANALEAFNNKQKAFIYYDQTLKTIVKNYSDHISIAQKFITFYNDLNLFKQVLQDLAIANPKNAEILKAIAYQFQTLGLKRETINIYERIFKLRPKYAQSYRDLANAYVENDQYKKAWRMYMSYLLQGNDVSGEGIGQILYNEMEFLYYNRRNQTDIKETFIPKSDNLFDFRNDVRLVFEWNTSEAEFDLEFVGPDLRVYVFEHSLANNQGLITDEKQKGYSSKEFFIDDIGVGEWLVNITYKGNKKPEPTYFKVTQYFNWGKANQTKKITVYKFQNEREKMQLIKLNKQLLVSSN
ncbi:MAG: carboxypeptidase-like regulatory domain-containing protein [Bacteroidetes bacterium]|nr:carboxypeptidase-like regulatory domain-containing protein [Bacteroidota bacterium]